MVKLFAKLTAILLRANFQKLRVWINLQTTLLSLLWGNYYKKNATYQKSTESTA